MNYAATFAASSKRPIAGVCVCARTGGTTRTGLQIGLVARNIAHSLTSCSLLSEPQKSGLIFVQIDKKMATPPGDEMT